VTELTDAKRRIVERLNRVDSATAGELATEFELTDTAIRQHLEALQAAGIVGRTDGNASGRGRPPARWQLAERAVVLFPDRHADLTLDLIESIRSTLGNDALGRVVAARAQRQAEQYRGQVGIGSIAVRVRRLADQRSAEGYMAEVEVDGDDVVLVEHHCPVRAAAGVCDALCQSELQVFGAALGRDVVVAREQHLLAGDRRCSYRVSPR